MASFNTLGAHDDLTVRTEAFELASQTRRYREDALMVRLVDLILRMGRTDQEGQARLEAELDLLFVIARYNAQHGEEFGMKGGFISDLAPNTYIQ